jgi:hypothetical protein
MKEGASTFPNLDGFAQKQTQENYRATKSKFNAERSEERWKTIPFALMSRVLSVGSGRHSN